MIDDIAEKVDAEERITVEDARRLMAHPNVTELGMLADAVRRRRWPEDVVTYNIGRNITASEVQAASRRPSARMPGGGFVWSAAGTAGASLSPSCR